MPPLHQGVAAETVGRNDVRPHLGILPQNGSDEGGLRKIEFVGVFTLAAQRLHHRPHRPVEDEDTALQRLTERDTILCHPLRSIL